MALQWQFGKVTDLSGTQSLPSACAVCNCGGEGFVVIAVLEASGPHMHLECLQCLDVHCLQEFPGRFIGKAFRKGDGERN